MTLRSYVIYASCLVIPSTPLFQNLFVSQLRVVFLQNVFQKVHNRGFFKFIFHKVAAEIIVFHIDRRRIYKVYLLFFFYLSNVTGKHADCAVAKYVVDGNFAVSDGKCGGVRYAAHNRAGCHGFAVLVFFVNVFDNAVFVIGRVLFKRARVNAIAVFVFNITARRAFSYRRVLDIKVGSLAEFGLAEIIPYCLVFLFNIGTVQAVSVAKLRIIATGKIIIPVFLRRSIVLPSVLSFLYASLYASINDFIAFGFSLNVPLL